MSTLCRSLATTALDSQRLAQVADAVLSVALLITVLAVVRVQIWVLVLVMHVPCCLSLLPILRGWHPRPGTPDVAVAGSGALPHERHTSPACNPALGPCA